ncbi:MAG: toprim domain-containing protein [Mediterraneibacter gnavus]
MQIIKNIRKIYLCLDNDIAGNAACENLAEKIPNDKVVMRLRPVKKDWNECLTAEVPVEKIWQRRCLWRRCKLQGRKSSPGHRRCRRWRKRWSSGYGIRSFPLERLL